MFSFLVVAVTATALMGQATNAPITPKERIVLFDGKSLAGWKLVSKDPTVDLTTIWSVQDGVIRCKGKPNGYARTEVAYQNYKLHAEWRWPEVAGNSGVFLHITGADKVWPNCLEAQLASGSAGEIRVNGGSLVKELTTENPKSVPRRTAGTEKPVGEWNTYDIICRGDTVSVRVNGVLQNEIMGSSVSSGAVGLQAEGKLVEFRNIVLEPLK
ncbi:MAG: hypothetical protein JWR19_2678 [Pedosphaera sp.]|nr:hypothetical protein [Pedosphaera sp.]